MNINLGKQKKEQNKNIFIKNNAKQNAKYKNQSCTGKKCHTSN